MARRFWSMLLRAVVAGTALLACTGCAVMGPRYIEDARGSYIEIIAQTDREELLSNLVRLRYMEAPVFVQIDGVTASPELQVQVSADLPFDDTFSDGQASPSLRYTESPTIVFKPLLGREFARELLVPIGLPPLLLLSENGWMLDEIFLLLVRSVNGTRNVEPRLYGARVDAGGRAGEGARFISAARALGALQRRGSLRIGTGSADMNTLTFTVDDAGRTSPDWQHVQEIFGLTADKDAYAIRLGLTGDDRTLAVETRPLLNAMMLLAQCIRLPGEESESALPQATTDLFTVDVDGDRPGAALVSVSHRGRWFSIADDDIDTKKTFLMLRILFNLQAQQTSEGGGVQLTLPVR